ncbi:hypothetical protein Tco_0538537 [Tanacetum coccineum]
MVAFLDKPTESDGFEQIVDFLNAHPIKYALTVNPTIYTSCIEQLWITAKVKTINGEVQIQALVDKKKVIITETSIRSDLQLEDAKAFFSPQWKFLIHTILQCLSAKTTAWNEFSSTMASTVICLATNQKFNFSKYIFDNMVKNLEGGVKFLMYPRKDTKVPQPSGSTEPITDKAANKEHVPAHFNDPLLSENTKTSQAEEITKLKERVKKLERRNKSSTSGIKRLRNVGRYAQIVSSKDEGLGAQEDVKKAVSIAKVTIVNATTTTVDELTLAQTLIEIKAAKPKGVTTATTTTTTVVTRPKARGVVVQEPELMDKRKKYFARLKAEEQRRKPTTKAQKRNQMCTYLKNMDGFTYSQMKNQSFDEVQKAFDKTIAEMKKHIEIVDDEEEIAVDVIPLATKPPIIIDWKIIKEGKMGYFQLIRAYRSSRRYSSMIKMLQNIDGEDLETLYKLVKAKHRNTRPEEAYETVLWGDLKVMFEPDIESDVWRNLQGHKLTVWKLFSSSGVHFVGFQNLHIFMLVEKKYPLTPATITAMLNKKLQADHWNEMCYQLLKLVTKQVKNPGSV